MSAPVVLVTGCSKGGIGFGLCEEFAAKGCIVYATARRLESMKGFQHENVHTLKLDVTDEAEVQLVVKTIIDKEGRLDVVVNNAGLPCAVFAIGPMSDIPADKVAATFNTNVFAALHVYRAVFPHMASRSTGTIINIGSVAGFFGTPWVGVYAASKAALERISEVQYMEARPFNVSVIHVSPGMVKSNINATVLSHIYVSQDSIFSGWLDSMRDIARAEGMPTEEFARGVVSSALEGKERHLVRGKMSTIAWVCQFLPRTYLLQKMWDAVAGKPKPKVE
ncbi:NAD(P)-binding protein [Daedalea quercina L-15889]|uniref:NAD(P)-binding protein n=1 Tax=Daedalea quercina L-15889 TaxID=1314783 RepID=A0A165UCR5_9APHY|nr:NAD(P)-binding protein [Daedalea quercina L-15889]